MNIDHIFITLDSKLHSRLLLLASMIFCDDNVLKSSKAADNSLSTVLSEVLIDPVVAETN